MPQVSGEQPKCQNTRRWVEIHDFVQVASISVEGFDLARERLRSRGIDSSVPSWFRRGRGWSAYSLDKRMRSVARTAINHRGLAVGLHCTMQIFKGPYYFRWHSPSCAQANNNPLLIRRNARQPLPDDEGMDVMCGFAEAAQRTHPSGDCHSV